MRRQGAILLVRLEELLLKRYEKRPSESASCPSGKGCPSRNGDENRSTAESAADRKLEELLGQVYRPGSVGGQR